MHTHDFSYSTTAKLIHLGLAIFGIAAFLTGELAEEGGRSGYLIHAYLGLSLAAVMLFRLGSGFGGAVILHTLVGQPVWQRMFRIGGPNKLQDS